MARHSGLKIGLLELVGQGLFLPPLMNRVAMSACVEGSAVQWSGHWSVMRSSLWFFAHRRLSQLPHPRALMSSVKRRLQRWEERVISVNERAIFYTKNVAMKRAL